MAKFFLLVVAIFVFTAVCKGRVTVEEMRQIINFHNSLRSKIAHGKVPGQPKGKNFKTLIWDSRLAREANRIANRCKFEHAAVHDSRFYVGQNIAQNVGPTLPQHTEWEKMIQLWFDEHKQFIYPTGTKGGVTGHYTQIAWAKTNFVGCSCTHCRKGKQYVSIYVCNYGPGGNIRNKPPYEKAD